MKHKSVKYLSTKKMEEILNSSYFCTDCGHSYEDQIDEIKEVYFKRIEKQVEENINNQECIDTFPTYFLQGARS